MILPEHILSGNDSYNRNKRSKGWNRDKNKKYDEDENLSESEAEVESSSVSENPKLDLESILTIALLLILTLVYTYLNLSPQRYISSKPRNFVIQLTTQQEFLELVKEMKDSELSWSSSFYSSYNSNYSSNSGWGKEGRADDFFLDQYYATSGRNEKRQREWSDPDEPIVPSKNYHCESSWITIRSELNYKYLWMHSGDNMYMGATASMDTPLQRKAFEMIPLYENCSEGWVRLREGDTDAFIFMNVPLPNQTVTTTSSSNVDDDWVVKLGSTVEIDTKEDKRYHFLIENEGYVLNRAFPSFLNVMTESEYLVRGHTSGWDSSQPAGREYGAAMHFQSINASLVVESHQKEVDEEKETLQLDEEYINQISKLPKSEEKRVISFGLYGNKPKYTQGAIRNAELAPIYFPNWICRYYITSDVPEDVISKLKDLGAEIESIPSGMGYIAGMFWRFMVASDETVDRYIIRDVDSRLNARDRLAVEEWINSDYPVHVIRDHVNHCIVMNGGMWGGTKDAVSFMKDRIMSWHKRDEYMADLYFLEESIWPDIQYKQMAHDSYCCDRFPNTKPFPTKRYPTYQHVGQVFDAHDNPRFNDIDGYIRGVPIPGSCRKQADWIYG